jgi:pyruvate dehydrogenase E2 component (dihydrolipoamide acetyltransferase)
MEYVYHLPDLGDDREEHLLGSWEVKVGMWVKVNQKLTEVELGKAIQELASPVAGRVLKLHCNPGDLVKTGMALVTLEVAEEGNDL